jgi:hypothetical protein
MIWIFFVVLIVTFSFLVWKKTVGRKTWMAIIVLAMLFSLFVAYISVSNIWTPDPLNDNVYREQNESGKFSGTLPWSHCSYPLTLTVFHTPFQQVTKNQYYAYGNAEFIISFANLSLIQVKGNYTYNNWVMGPAPLHYQIDSIFSNSLEFFWSLVALFTVFNFLAGIVAIIIANGFRIIRWHHRNPRKKALEEQPLEAETPKSAHLLTRHVNRVTRA